MPEVLQVVTLAILKYRVTAQKTVYVGMSKFTRCRENDDRAGYQDKRMSAGWNSSYLFCWPQKVYPWRELRRCRRCEEILADQNKNLISL